jgi:hypothetical protein
MQRLPYRTPILLIQAIVAIICLPVLAISPVRTLGNGRLRYGQGNDLVLVASTPRSKDRCMLLWCSFTVHGTRETGRTVRGGRIAEYDGRGRRVESCDEEDGDEVGGVHDCGPRPLRTVLCIVRVQ